MTLCRTLEGGCNQLWPARPGEEQYEWEEPRVVDDTNNGRRTTCKHFRSSKEKRLKEGQKDIEQTDNRQAQSELGGAVDGLTHRVDPIANRVDRLRLLGNGVVSQCAEIAWRTLWKEMNNG